MLIARGGQLYTPWCMNRTTTLASNESKQQLSSSLEARHRNIQVLNYRCNKIDFLFSSAQSVHSVSPGEEQSCNIKPII